MQHVHTARKAEFASFIRRKFHLGRFESRQVTSDPKVADDDLLAAGRCFVAIEIQLHGNAVLDNDPVRTVAALDRNADLLHAGRIGYGCDPFPLAEKVPQHQSDHADASDNYDDLCCVHIYAPCLASLKDRSRKLFVKTETLERLIAALAMTGERSHPKNGYKIPAATGIPITL